MNDTRLFTISCAVGILLFLGLALTAFCSYQDISCKQIEQMGPAPCQTGLALLALLFAALAVFALTGWNRSCHKAKLLQERQAYFEKATEQLYDKIHEFDITRNRSVGKRTDAYFESLGAKGLPYNLGLRVAAEKQIHPDFQKEFLRSFAPENLLRQYEAGNTRFHCEIRLAPAAGAGRWTRIDAHVFYAARDKSIRMFTYWKNIDREKEQEQIARTDEMTGFYTRKATERAVDALLSERPEGLYAFFLFDIDNFKQVNDRFGHVFGDSCIQAFTSIIKRHFRNSDVFGRVGGDEFAVFVPVPDEAWASERASALSEALRSDCRNGSARWRLSASIGVAFSPRNGTHFNALYEAADHALYQTKKKGKDGFTLCDAKS